MNGWEEKKLTDYSIVVWVTCKHVGDRNIHRYHNVDNHCEPPVFNQRADSIDQALKKEQIAKLDRYDGAPGQNGFGKNEFVEFGSLLFDVRRNLEIRRAGVYWSDDIQSVHVDEKQHDGGDQAGKSKQKSAIIDAKLALDADPNVETCDNADNA